MPLIRRRADRAELGGLGLALAIAEACGSSEYGARRERGSFKWSSLHSWPPFQAGQSRKVPENRLPIMTADRFDFLPLRIFVVEDDNDTLAAIQIHLEQLGHVVFSARSKAEALKKIPHAKCHVLISDINLPDGNGWEILEEIENLRPNYAIAISGHATRRIVKRARNPVFDTVS
jgi:CheY-like chemotaxis protein